MAREARHPRAGQGRSARDRCSGRRQGRAQGPNRPGSGKRRHRFGPEATPGKEGSGSERQPQGLAKGDERDNKADAKAGGQSPQLDKKDGKGPDPQTAAAKGADPKEAKNSGVAKDDQPLEKNAREATSKEVADLKEKLDARSKSRKH